MVPGKGEGPYQFSAIWAGWSFSGGEPLKVKPSCQYLTNNRQKGPPEAEHLYRQNSRGLLLALELTPASSKHAGFTLNPTPRSACESSTCSTFRFVNSASDSLCFCNLYNDSEAQTGSQVQDRNRNELVLAPGQLATRQTVACFCPSEISMLCAHDI